VKEIAIDIVKDYNNATMIKYNARDADLYAWLARRPLCASGCMRRPDYQGVRCGTLWPTTRAMGFCLIQSVAISQGKLINLGVNSVMTDKRKIEGRFVIGQVVILVIFLF
jgi:hypothetical protein